MNKQSAEALLHTAGWQDDSEQHENGRRYVYVSPYDDQPRFESLGDALNHEAIQRSLRWGDHDLLFHLGGETAEQREARIIAATKPLVNVPCDCGEDTGFRCYPEDGQCECGCWKHHVHNQCGHIVQWG